MPVELPSTGPEWTAETFQRIAHQAFDVLWQAKVTAGAIDGDIMMLRDIGVDLGFPPGGLPNPLPFAKFFELNHPDDRPAVQQAIDESTASGKPFYIVHRFVGVDQRVTWWEAHGIALDWSPDSTVHWIGAARNITVHRQLQEDLQRALAEANRLRSRLELDNLVLQEEVERTTEFHELIGASPLLERVKQSIAQVAGSSTSVLITGETGTGKELVAREIHRRSQRVQRPMVVVNCAALPPSLIESELFGHERGAFTGAVSRRLGCFERADGTTLFLDEVGELPLDMQAKLLRVLDTGEFSRVGSHDSRRVDARVVAATNRNLLREVESGNFRRDLYHRLHVFPIELPPLRERREDIPLLVAYLVDHLGRRTGSRVRRVSDGVMARLVAWDWPGNVRELENVVERSLLQSRGTELEVDMLGAARHAAPLPVASGAPAATGSESLVELERRHIAAVCASSGWRIKGAGGAAERLGVKPATLYFRMKKLGISRPDRDGETR